MAKFYSLATYNQFEQLPVLSKVKIGEQVYYLKDAEVRALIENYGDAVTYNVDTTFNASSENLATQKAIAEYLTKEIADLNGAMHFVGVEDELPADVGNAGDVIIVGSAEYVSDGEKWILFGDEGVYATVAGVEAAYVKKTLTIAGIDLADAITADELKVALGLGALAYKDSATGTIGNVVTAVEDATYTPAGNVTVELEATSTAMASTGNFTPVGTVSAPTVTVTPDTTQIQHINSVGTLPTYTGAVYTAPSVTEQTSKFATAGMIAAMDGEDAELLVLSVASTADAITSTGFNAGSYTAAEFNAGSLPTLGDAQTVVTGIASAVATAPTFTGTEGAVSVSGNYDKASVKTATFAGTEATISHNVTTEAKTVTVQ